MRITIVIVRVYKSIGIKQLLDNEKIVPLMNSEAFHAHVNMTGTN